MKLKTSFDFDAAHRLIGHQGKCSNLHGHIWHVDIEISTPDDKNYLDCNGILWDFGNRKMLKDLFDHKTILKNCFQNGQLIELLREENNEMYLMSENPTAEFLCYEILQHLKTLNSDLKYKIKVWESPKSYAEIEG